MDTATLEKELAEANANVAAAEQRLAVAPGVDRQAKEEVGLAETEAARSKRLVPEGAGSQQKPGRPTATKLGTTKAGLAEADASMKTAKAADRRRA